MDENTELLKVITAYCEREGIAESTFGYRAVNDGKLVDRLRAGKSITLATYRKVLVVIASGQRPEPAEAAQ